MKCLRNIGISIKRLNHYWRILPRRAVVSSQCGHAASGIDQRGDKGASPWNIAVWFPDPQKDQNSHQWNVEIQSHMADNFMLSVACVGSASRNLELGGAANKAPTPGPGLPDQVNARRGICGFGQCEHPRPRLCSAVGATKHLDVRWHLCETRHYDSTRDK
jgi:hypothetical protein